MVDMRLLVSLNLLQLAMYFKQAWFKSSCSELVLTQFLRPESRTSCGFLGNTSMLSAQSYSPELMLSTSLPFLSGGSSLTFVGRL